MQDDIEPELLLSLHGRSGDGDGRVTGDRLKHDAGEGQIEFCGLFGDDEAVFGIGDDDRRCIALSVGDTLQGLLKQADVSGEG